MEERYLTGYCRCLDSARVVEVIVEDGKLTECDCGYETCKFKPQCTIAQQLGELAKAAE